MRIAFVVGCLAVLTAVCFHSLAPAPVSSQTSSQTCSQDSWKAAHAARVVQELSVRDVSHLTALQRQRRAENLVELAAYGKRGAFAQNVEWPGEAIPHLIDHRGARCALANLIDKSGSDALLQRLSRRNNIAFVPELRGDVELQTWLAAEGFTMEEAAYIQGPGQIDDTPDDVEDDTEDALDQTPPTPASIPSGPTTSGGGAPRMGSTARGRAAGGSSVANWKRWWDLNRHAFLNLRQRYHRAVVVTGAAEGEKASKGRRPSDAEVSASVIPLLKKLATEREGPVRATALMAWARAARPQHAPAVVEATLAYLRDEGNQYRDLMILALGVLQHEDVLPPLRALLHDSPEGRAIFGRKSPVPEHTRAYAAIALGQAGQTSSIGDLMRVLGDEGTKSPDLLASCVMGLGSLARTADAGECRRVGAFLVKNLRARAWPDVVLAAVPIALGNAGDELLFLGTLQPILERFRKPTLVRQSAALALGARAPRLTDPLFDTLLATARRDPDENARRFGILALGEIAARQPVAADGQEQARSTLGKKLLHYYKGAFAGRSSQKTDLPWLCLSAALFGRGFPEHADDVHKALRRIVSRGAHKERQAAAVVALGVVGDREAVPMLSKLYGAAKDKLLKGYLAETLGILGDRTQREKMLELVRTDGSARVRYRAALGLGFMADGELVKSLAETLASTNSSTAKVALARVIGELGDRRVLSSLIRVAGDESADLWTRRRALGAIGMIAEEEDHAWTCAYKRGANYPAATPTLRMVLSLF